MTSVAPVSDFERHQPIDVLRGFAVLGILVMNIQLFAMPFAAFVNPFALGEPTRRDFVIWSASHLFADQKFMTIFSLLFGAGVLLLTTRVEERGGRPAAVHYRRVLGLLMFGMLHTYLLWYGDILVLYAVCGLWVYVARRLSARTLLGLGLTLLAVGSALSLVTGLSMRFWPPEMVAALSDDFWRPPPERIAEEVAAFRGGWLTQMPLRATYSLDMHTSEIWSWGIWRAGGLMLAGMALFKWRVLTGERAPAFYTKLAVIGFLLGLPLSTWGLIQNQASGWNLRDGYFLNSQWNYWGSLLTSLGWIGLVMRVWHAGVARVVVERLSAVGRMAFTCYIAETVICTTIFYGHGLGLFGRVDRLGQMIVGAGRLGCLAGACAVVAFPLPLWPS